MENIDHDLPECFGISEEYCMLEVEGYRKSQILKSDCLKQCTTKTSILTNIRKAKGEPIFRQGEVQLDIYLNVAPEKITYKEYLIYDGVGMFGSIGGSLGLFVGFSLFDSLSLVLDYCLKKLKCI